MTTQRSLYSHEKRDKVLNPNLGFNSLAILVPRKTQYGDVPTYRPNVEVRNLVARTNVSKRVNFGVLRTAEENDFSIGHVVAVVAHGARVPPGSDQPCR